MPKNDDSSCGPKRQLTLLDATCIIIGIIIGAGIFETAPLIASNISTPELLIAAWVLGGLIALAGALCYTELVSAYPQEGGDYVFLNKAFGQRTGFLFAWANFWIIRPGNIGAMVFIAARYADQLMPLGMSEHGLVVYAVGIVVLLTVINILGVKPGTWTQNGLTIMKAIGLLAIVIVGAILVTPITPVTPAPPVAPVETGDSSTSSFLFAMIFIMFAFGGWNEMSYVAAELRNPRKNILRAFVLGTVGVTCIYLLINLAAIRALTYDGLADSPAFATEIMGMQFKQGGSTFISLLICVSCIGAANGMIFTGSRIFYAVGGDHRSFKWLGKWNRTLDTPLRSLLLQAAVTVGLMIAFGLQGNGFERLVVFTGVFFWYFFLLIGLSLFLLRHKFPDARRPYKVVLYPVIPVLFCLSSVYMLYSSLTYAIDQGNIEGFWAVVVMTVGLGMTIKSKPTKLQHAD